MNGRVYDPDLGRFLSPDPNVQFVADLQTYNRYTYAANNPLRYTDPTGYFFSATFDMIVETGIAIAGMVACAYTAGAGCAFAFSLMAATYSTASAIHGGAGWSNAIGVGLLQLGVGVVAGGFVDGALGDPLTRTASEQLIGGAVSTAASAAFMTPLSRGGWGNLGKNLLIAEAECAAFAALGYTIQSAMVSYASAQKTDGSGGSGEAQLDAFETNRAVQWGADDSSGDFLQQKVTAENLRQALKLIGMEGILDDLQANNVEVDLYQPGHVVGNNRAGACVIMSDLANSWTIWNGDVPTVLINQNDTTEIATIGLMHEYVHVNYGDELLAFEVTADIAQRLQPFGGMQANIAPISQLIVDGTVNESAIETYLSDRANSAGSLYSISNRQVIPDSVARIF